MQPSAFQTAPQAPEQTPTAAQPKIASESQAQYEANLIRRILSGQRELFYELIQPYQRMLFAIARSTTNNDGDAEDCVQEAALKALAHLGDFRGACKFSTWLTQIAVNEARLRYRRDRVKLYDSLDERGAEEDGQPGRDISDGNYNPEEAAMLTALRSAILEAIQHLDPAHRSVFELRDIQGHSIRTTANRLGISEANVKTRLLRARLRVRETLERDWGGRWSDCFPNMKPALARAM